MATLYTALRYNCFLQLKYVFDIRPKIFRYYNPGGIDPEEMEKLNLEKTVVIEKGVNIFYN